MRKRISTGSLKMGRDAFRCREIWTVFRKKSMDGNYRKPVADYLVISVSLEVSEHDSLGLRALNKLYAR